MNWTKGHRWVWHTLSKNQQKNDRIRSKFWSWSSATKRRISSQKSTAINKWTAIQFSEISFEFFFLKNRTSYRTFRRRWTNDTLELASSELHRWKQKSETESKQHKSRTIIGRVCFCEVSWRRRKRAFRVRHFFGSLREEGIWYCDNMLGLGYKKRKRGNGLMG